LQFVTLRLVFIEAEAKVFLTDIYFLVILFLSVRIAWVVIRLLEEEAHIRMALNTERGKEMAPLVKLSVMVLRIIIGLLAATILLAHFGVEITAFMAALGLGGLAISLAARDTIADAIAGFIILIDRPFRVGDRIEIKAAGTWGDVVEIGLRTTQIRTRDNRMVIIPNSTISSNEVINYSYPDPQYRIETHVGIAYGTPIEEVRQLLAETVAKVEGVLDTRPVDVLYIEMGEFAMIFRVRWWVESFVDTRRIVDRVHTAMQNTIDQAGIQSPYPTSVTELKIDPAAARQLRGRLDDSGPPLEPPPSSYSPED
jgi:small-conductance mechanosensitive channel